MNSSFFDNIRFNNLQLEIKALQNTVTSLAVDIGNTGGIIGDLNMNNHNVTNVNTLNFNGGSSITSSGGEALFLNGYYVYLGGGLEGQGNYIHNVSGLECNTINSGATATLQTVSTNSLNLPYNNTIVGVTGGITVNGSSVLVSPISSDFSLNNHNLTNVNQISLENGVTMSTDPNSGITITTPRTPINLDGSVIYLNGSVECGANNVHSVGDLSCVTMEASTSLSAPLANVTTANLTTANVGTLDLGSGNTITGGYGITLNTNDYPFFCNTNIELSGHYLHNVSDLTTNTITAAAQVTVETVPLTANAGKLLVSGNEVVTSANVNAYVGEFAVGDADINMQKHNILNAGKVDVYGQVLQSQGDNLTVNNNLVVTQTLASDPTTTTYTMFSNYSVVGNTGQSQLLGPLTITNNNLNWNTDIFTWTWTEDFGNSLATLPINGHSLCVTTTDGSPLFEASGKLFSINGNYSSTSQLNLSYTQTFQSGSVDPSDLYTNYWSNTPLVQNYTGDYKIYFLIDNEGSGARNIPACTLTMTLQVQHFPYLPLNVDSLTFGAGNVLNSTNSNLQWKGDDIITTANIESNIPSGIITSSNFSDAITPYLVDYVPVMTQNIIWSQVDAFNIDLPLSGKNSAVVNGKIIYYFFNTSNNVIRGAYEFKLFIYSSGGGGSTWSIDTNSISGTNISNNQLSSAVFSMSGPALIITPTFSNATTYARCILSVDAY